MPPNFHQSGIDRVSSWFNNIAKTCQMPMVLDQMGEPVYVSRVGALSIHENDQYPIRAIVKVTSRESTTRSGQAMIEVAEVLLPVLPNNGSLESMQYEGIIENLTTAHVIKIRGQILSIESIGTEDGGFRKLICKAVKREFTSRSTLNGRM